MSQDRRYWPATVYHVTPDVLTAAQAAAGLTWAERAVLDTLLDHDYHLRGYRKGVVWVGAARLAAETGCCERTVYRCLDKLVKVGLVSRRQRGHGRSAVTVIAWDRLIPDGPGSSDTPYPTAVTGACQSRKREAGEADKGYFACGGPPAPGLRSPFEPRPAPTMPQPPEGLSVMERAQWRADWAARQRAA